MRIVGFRRRESTLFFNFPMSGASRPVRQVKRARSNWHTIARSFFDGAVVRMEAVEARVDFDSFDITRDMFNLSAAPAY